MVEGSVEGLTGLLEAIAGWGAVDPTILGNGFITLFGGGITGALINQWFIDRRERNKLKDESKAVRTLLSLEIDHNRGRLAQRKKGLRDLAIMPGPSEDTLRNMGFRTVNRPRGKQTFQREALIAMMVKLPGSLNTSEIQAVWDLYADMARLFDSLSEPLPTDETRRKVAAMLLEEIDRVLERGNPLA